MTGRSVRSLPFDPLGDVVEALLGPLAARVGCSGGRRGDERRVGLELLLGSDQMRTNYLRIRRVGRVTWEMADRMAIAVGRHPSEIWGDTWWGLPSAEDLEADRRARGAAKARDRRARQRAERRPEAAPGRKAHAA